MQFSKLVAIGLFAVRACGIVVLCESLREAVKIDAVVVAWRTQADDGRELAFEGASDIRDDLPDVGVDPVGVVRAVPFRLIAFL